jgi:dihydrofolate reductase
MLEAIAAMARNRVIGRENGLPWKLSADLKRFKALTSGQVLLMGRKTYESIGRPLPGRITWVVSRQNVLSFSSPEVVHFRTLEEALERARGESRRVVIAGGETLYRQTLPVVERLYLTVIDRDLEGDAHFPELDLTSWKNSEDQTHFDPTLECAYRFQTWQR